jgi:hypothetical protein
VRHTRALKIARKFPILATAIRLNKSNLSVQEALNMDLKGIENLFDIRLMFEKINPTKTGVVIHKTNIKLVSPEEVRAGPQTSE